MSQLSVDGACQKNENRDLAQNIAPLRSLDSLRVQGASSKVSENYYQADHHSGGRMRVVVFTWQKFHLFSSLSLDFTCTQVSSFLFALRCPWQTSPTTSRVSLKGCFQMWRCSLRFVSSARQFSLETRPPEERFYGIFTPISPKLIQIFILMWVMGSHETLWWTWILCCWMFMYTCTVHVH